jgi:hypothetical protein
MFELTTLYFLCSAPIHGFEGNDSRIDDLYNQFGPTPRICFDYLEDKFLLDRHESLSARAISDLSSRHLLKIVLEAQEFNIDGVSDTIFLVRRRGDLSRRLSTVEPITAVVDMAIRNQLRRETQAEQFILYRSLVNVEGTRRIAGVPYELLAQEKLQRHDYELVPIEYTPDQGRTSPRWNSVHGSSAHPSSVRFSIHGTVSDSYTSMPSPINDYTFYVPEPPNQVTFIKTARRLYVFQFTISSNPDIQKGISNLFPQDLQPSKLEWRFVFVVPPSVSELSCPLQSEMMAFLGPVNFYTMVVDPEPEPEA